MKIGFIGQGWIGRNYADDFADRGYDIVRFSLDPEYKDNEAQIAECDIVFIAVPTPTTPQGFDSSIVQSVVKYVGAGKTAVIKSTNLPGTALSIQEQYPDRTVLYSPEFLSEATARQDVSKPFVSIVGMTRPGSQQEAAAAVLAVLPPAPFSRIMTSTEAEIFKYAHNTAGYVQIVYFNMLYDLAKEMGQGWDNIGAAIKADPYISNRYADPIHKSGRGAGGHCFIKDFKAFSDFYKAALPEDASAAGILEALQAKNNGLLVSSNKDIDLLEQTYGNEIADSYAKNR